MLYPSKMAFFIMEGIKQVLGPKLPLYQMKECENIKTSEYGQIHHCTGHEKPEGKKILLWSLISISNLEVVIINPWLL